MDYKEAARRIKEHIEYLDTMELPMVAHTHINEALNMAIKALEDKDQELWNLPPIGGFHDD